MTTIFHSGRTILRQNIGNRNYAEIADLLYFRISGSKYFNDQGKPFFLLPNIDHIATATGFCKRLCEKALAYLEKHNWIHKVRVRCHDGAVRIKIFLADRFSKVMRLIDSHLTKNSAELNLKNTIKPSVSADSAQNTESDSARYAESYIKEQRKKEENNNHNSQTKNNDDERNKNSRIVKTVVFDFSSYGLGKIECDAEVKMPFDDKQQQVIQIISSNYIEIDGAAFNNYMLDDEIQSKACDFKHLTMLAYRKAKAVKQSALEPLPSVDDVKAQIQDKLNGSIATDTKEDEQNKQNSECAEDNKNDDKGRKGVLDTAKQALAKITEAIESKKSQIQHLSHKEEQRLIAELLAVKMVETQLIIDTANNLIDEYGKMTLDELIEHLNYLLIELPERESSKTPSVYLSRFNDFKDDLPEVINQYSPCLLPTQEELKRPVLSEAEKHADLVKAADQSLYVGILPDCQRKALAAIIDYVKRQGVVIGCNNEMYRWLYFMVSKSNRSYSKAHDFTHWCHIAISQLQQKKLNRPIGFDRWHAECQQMGKVA